MGYRMYLPFLLLAVFSSSFIPDCLASTFRGKCGAFGLIDGQLKTKVTWECFPNNTKICTTWREDCSKCDGQLSGSVMTEEPKTQAGRIRRGYFRFKREVSARGRGRRRSPRYGRGEIEDSDTAKKEAEDDNEVVDTGKKEADAGKEDIIPVKDAGKEGEAMVGVEIKDKPFTCENVCLEKDGKHAKGEYEYNTFEDCEGGAKTEESKNQKEEETKDKEEKVPTEKKEKDEKEKAARRRRMRRNRF